MLVAEDDTAVRNLTRTTLEDFGYRVIEAVDGVDAVEKFKTHKESISLLLLDLIMPRKNGRETYEDIREFRSDIKAVFMSGYTADIIKQKGIVEDGLEFISKPVAPLELLRRIRDILDK